jgi:endonuclease YncB( thermonuclease family)
MSTAPKTDFNFAFARNARGVFPHRLLRTSDGDTPVIDQPVRMVSVDTPEKAGYAGKPSTAQPKLNRARARLVDGTYDGRIPAELRDYLVSKLTPDAAERHIGAGMRASQVFDALLAARLTRASGSTRPMATKPTGEIIDRYGRMLAYLAPWFSGAKSDPVPPPASAERRTFNLDMVSNGWGSAFMVYPSLPQRVDWNLFVREARAAWNAKAGMWAEFGADLLLGYEYRMCIKLAHMGTAAKPFDAAMTVDDAFQRVCVDLATMTEVGPFGFHTVDPPDRLWYWQDDDEAARRDLRLRS